MKHTPGRRRVPEKRRESLASGGQGGDATVAKIPWTPGCECSRPSFLRPITFADGLRPWTSPVAVSPSSCTSWCRKLGPQQSRRRQYWA